VSADVDAIGFVGLSSVRNAKALMIEDATTRPLVASPLTISTEDYPLTRRLYLYTGANTSDVARSFVDFVVSDDGQAVVPTVGFVDLRPDCDAHPAPGATCSSKYQAATVGACRASVSFRFDSATQQLDTRGLRDLQRLTAALSRPEYSGKSAVLVGFSDASGSRARDLESSLTRARAVADQLRARGVRVANVIGVGSEMPLGDDKTTDGRDRNRRVELWLH
jgi:phosphate transport system substrate-binding protein